MGWITLTLPHSIYVKIAVIAAREGIAVDRFVVSAAAEKLAAYTTTDLEQRAARGSREKLHSILDRVPHVPPDPGDEL